MEDDVKELARELRKQSTPFEKNLVEAFEI